MFHEYKKLSDSTPSQYSIYDRAAALLDEKNNIKQDTLKNIIGTALNEKKLPDISVTDTFWYSDFQNLIVEELSSLNLAMLSKEQLFHAIQAALLQKAAEDDAPVYKSTASSDYDPYYVDVHGDSCCLYMPHHSMIGPHIGFNFHHHESCCDGGHHGAGSLNCDGDAAPGVLAFAVICSGLTSAYFATRYMDKAKDSNRGRTIKWVIALTTAAVVMYEMSQCSNYIDGVADGFSEWLEKKEFPPKSVSEGLGNLVAWLAVVVTPGLLASSACCCFFGCINTDNTEGKRATLRASASQIATKHKIEPEVISAIQTSTLMNYIHGAKAKGSQYLAAIMLTIQAKHVSEKQKAQVNIDIEDSKVASFGISSGY